jgi:hypothetical protein
VNFQQTVSKFIARWVAEEKLDARPSLVTLRLVRCGSRKPTAEEEEAAVVLDDPSLSLGESGVTSTSWLLADIFRTAEQNEAEPLLSVVSVSDEYAKQLAAASPGELSSAEDVRRLLASPLPLPVLVDKSHSGLLAAALGRFNVKVRPPDRATPELEALLESARCYCVTSGTEEVWASFADALTGSVWRQLSSLSGTFAYLDNRNAVDRSGATQQTLRPDYCGWSNHALIVKAEHKSTQMELSKALSELAVKMAANVYTRLNMPFLPCFAVGGDLLQFAVLLPEAGGGVRLETVSDPLSMVSHTDRLRILAASFQMFRVLVWLRSRMPAVVIPLYEEQWREDGGCIMVYEACVVKTCRSAAPAGVYDLLFASAIPCAITITSCSRQTTALGLMWRLEVRPVGLQVLPTSEAELCCAMRCVLRALAALHAHGYVHRDVRWPNVLSLDSGEWLLIDFELAGATGAPVPEGRICRELVSPEARPTGTPYTAADDVWQVGRLMQMAEELVLSREAEAFAALLTTVQEQRPSASEALLLPWLADEPV